MKLDALTRLIDACSFLQLREIALAVLRWQGFDARLTDGPYDGGADIRLYAPDGTALPQVVACSIERDWQKKVREDANKAQQNLGIHHLKFVSSRRIPEASWLVLEAELALQGISVQRLDQQSIASLALHYDKLPDLLQLLDVSTNRHRSRQGVSRAEEAAFAFAFFGDPANDLRSELRQRALEVALHALGGSGAVPQVCAQAKELLGGAEQEADLKSLIDRMRQNGRLAGRNGHVDLPAGTHGTLDALLDLRQLEEREARALIATCLHRMGVSEPVAVDVVWQDLGVLLLPEGSILGDHAGSKAAMRRLHASLSAFGLSDRTGLLADLLREVGTAPLAAHLRTGAITRTLYRLPATGLAAAVGAPSEIQVVLDASVAIPMLCALFHGGIQRRFFLIAATFYGLARELGLELAIPEVWLEEMAAHLLAAAEYAGPASVDRSGLEGSRNAFVAYFASAGPLDDFPTLLSFLASFGLQNPQLAATDYPRARRAVEAELRRLLRHYGVTTIATPATRDALVEVEVAWTWAARDAPRPAVTAKHDQTVLAWLRAAERPTGTLAVSWDSLLLDLGRGRVLDPLGVTDLLRLVAPGPIPAFALEFVALTLAEEQVERAAAVWDALVHLERGQLSDASLLGRAEQFKAAFLARNQGDVDRERVRVEWERVKGAE